MTSLRTHHRLTVQIVAVIAAGAALLGCSGGSEDAGDEASLASSPPVAPVTSDASAPAETSSAPMTSDADTESDTDSDSDSGDDGGAVDDGPAVDRSLPWLPPLQLLTAPTDDHRPLLEWEAVPDASSYSVRVYSADGRAYWAWRTDATSVHLGGDPRLDDDQSGPSTAPGMRWSVLAFDADDEIIAASADELLRP